MTASAAIAPASPPASAGHALPAFLPVKPTMPAAEPSGDAASGDAATTGGDPEAVLRLLSPRVAQIARLAAAGRSSKAIALELGISDATVKAHLKSCFRTLGIERRAELVGALGRAPATGRRNDVVLSPMKECVAALVAAGMPNKAIAAELSLTEETVKAHVRGITQKVGVANRVELAGWYLSRAGVPMDGVVNAKMLADRVRGHAEAHAVERLEARVTALLSVVQNLQQEVAGITDRLEGLRRRLAGR